MHTPLIVCNIGHEVALEAGDALHYTPPRLIRQMRSALWSLPLWASPAWLERDLWWVHPFSESLSPYLTDRELSHIAKGDVGDSELMLWGHERSLAHSLAKQYGLCGGEVCSELPQELMPCWTRAASARFFEKYSSVPWRSRVAMITQIEELVELLTQDPCLVKLPFSSSGRGLWRINRLDSQLEETLRQLTESLSDPNELTQALAQHRAYLSREVAPYYCGAVGIDLLTYRPDGVSSRTALHPWVEINLRYTMGHYALDLYRERVPQGSYDQYRFGILSAPRAKALLSTADAPTLDDTGCLCSGLLPLTSTDLTTASHFAYLRTL